MSPVQPSSLVLARPLHVGGHTDAAQAAINAFHADVVQQVASAVERDAVVVVGMSLNPFVGKATKALTGASVQHSFLCIGGYGSKWKERLAIKMWSGWPTFPQVFVQGKLLGGFKELDAALQSGELRRMIAAGRAA